MLKIDIFNVDNRHRHGGDQVLPFGADLFAVPVSALWSSHQPKT